MHYEISDEHIQIILNALGNTPYRVAANVIHALGEQIAERRGPNGAHGVDPANAAKHKEIARG